MSNIKVASISPKVVLASPIDNARIIISSAKEAFFEGARIIVFPKLCVTGNTIYDLRGQSILLKAAKNALNKIAKETEGIDALIVVSSPILIEDIIVDAAIGFYKGEQVLLIADGIDFEEYTCNEFKLPGLDKTISLCFDDAIISESDIVISASDGSETLGSNNAKLEYFKDFSKETNSLVIFSSSGFGESTTYDVHTGFKFIINRGKVISKACARLDECVIADVDLDSKVIDEETFADETYNSKAPYIPRGDVNKHLDKALDLAARGLMGRLTNIGCKKVVIGVSGGLDSAMALITVKKAFDLMANDYKNIIAITMPCFGTSSITRNLALRLMKELGVFCKEIDITESVKLHLSDISHDISNRNITYENAQARERTQVLMDIANDNDAIVVGTGDLSEAALGFCTYGGDSISMYNVNVGMPKTLIKMVLTRYADICESENLSKIIKEIVDIPASPELISNSNCQISQRTEDIIGPYELIDFILYYALMGDGPMKIYNALLLNFSKDFDQGVIKKTIKVFYERFFKNQFKRTATPAGPRILLDMNLTGSDCFDIPSDVNAKLWLSELENI